MASSKDYTGALDSKPAARKRENVATTILGDDDVLLGRGKGSYNHEGNIRFRKLVLERACAYRANENRTFRRAMANEIIAKITKNGGKFLRPAKDTTGGWEAVSAPIARTKVKQALRDAAFALESPSNETSNKSSALPPAPFSLSAAAPSNTQHLLGSLGAARPELTLPIQLNTLVPPLPSGMRGQFLEQAQQDNARQLQLAALLQYSNMAPNPMLALQQQQQHQMMQNQFNLIDQHALAQLGGASLPQPSTHQPYSILSNFDGRSGNSGMSQYFQTNSQSQGIQDLLSRVPAPSPFSSLPQGLPQLGRNDLILQAARQSLSQSLPRQGSDNSSSASPPRSEDQPPPRTESQSPRRER